MWVGRSRHISKCQNHRNATVAPIDDGPDKGYIPDHPCIIHSLVNIAFATQDEHIFSPKTQHNIELLLLLLLLLQPFYGPLSRTTRVSRYQKKHSPTHHPDHQPSFISFFHLLRSIASSLFNLHAGKYFYTTTLQVLFGLPIGLQPSTSYSIHFFTQSVSSFRNTCPYQCRILHK